MYIYIYHYVCFPFGLFMSIGCTDVVHMVAGDETRRLDKTVRRDAYTRRLNETLKQDRKMIRLHETLRREASHDALARVLARANAAHKYDCRRLHN